MVYSIIGEIVIPAFAYKTILFNKMRYIFQEVGIKQQAHIMGGLFIEYSMGGCVVCVRGSNI